ncbi:MAG: lecithin retinol acyltransferase family protein [Venatoribacter sp.]
MTDYNKGDHLAVDHGWYTHHGIYMGNQQVIHYAGKHESLLDNSNSHVQKTSLRKFASGKPIKCIPEPNAKYSAEQIVERAKHRLNENEYSVFTNNCEHFVNDCIHGRKKSEQINKVTDAATTFSVGAIAFGIIRFALSNAHHIRKFI